MPFEIKNTKDFPYLRIFFKHESVCYCTTPKCTIQMVMHIKMSWMTNIKNTS